MEPRSASNPSRWVWLVRLSITPLAEAGRHLSIDHVHRLIAHQAQPSLTAPLMQLHVHRLVTRIDSLTVAVTSEGIELGWWLVDTWEGWNAYRARFLPHMQDELHRDDLDR
jgi:hypothetical protein